MRRRLNGRIKITIPVSYEDFSEDPIKYIDHYLGNCVSKNNENKNDAELLNDYYVGIQEILKKTRLNGVNDNNNKLVANHIYRQVEFKKGFMVGNPISYSLAVADKNTSNLTDLNKYLKDSAKASLDIEKYEDLYVSGLAVQFIIPKTTDFEDGEAPFELYNLKVGSAFKVYSSDVTSKPLFDVIITKTVDKEFNTIKRYDVYYIDEKDEKKYCYVIKYTDIGNPVKRSAVQKEPYKQLPLIEYSLNKNRMGIVELVMAIQDGLNIIQSNQIDDIVEFVNSYLVFENQDLGKDWAKKVKDFRKNRAILLKTKNPQLPAKLNLLKQTMQHTEINAFFELLVQEMYDIVACPKTSGGVTSGGDTGQARILGNGWESAQNQATVDITFVLRYEYELLKKMIRICKETDKIKDIVASDIDIKFSINMSNNILTKTQALQNLYDMHIPYEESLDIVNITSDTHGLAIKWAKNDEEQKTIAMKMQTQKLGENLKNQNDSNTTQEEDSDENKKE